MTLENNDDSEKLSKLDDFELCLAQSMFHVMSDDIDSETGAKLEEVILLQHLAAEPSILKYKSLKQFVEENTGKCYSADVKKENDNVIRRQKQKDYWKNYEDYMKGVSNMFVGMLQEDDGKPIEEQYVPDYKIVDGEIVFDYSVNESGLLFITANRCPSVHDGVLRTPEHVVRRWRQIKNEHALTWLRKNSITYEEWVKKNRT